jgi:hypothetical protein
MYWEKCEATKSWRAVYESVDDGGLVSQAGSRKPVYEPKV